MAATCPKSPELPLSESTYIVYVHANESVKVYYFTYMLQLIHVGVYLHIYYVHSYYLYTLYSVLSMDCSCTKNLMWLHFMNSESNQTMSCAYMCM